MNDVSLEQVLSARPAIGPRVDILLVDDDRSLLEIFSIILRKEGYLVKAVSNGKDALAALEDQWFDLVITDLHMPEVNGLTILKVAKEVDKNIAVIIVTGDHNFEFALEALQLEADGYLLKPCRLDELRRCVEACLRKNSGRTRFDENEKESASTDRGRLLDG
ncbi:MAG TPA: response regulator [Thermodesulfobacteriota bacterium]|mgnify:CR=1 FL=1|nr:response regulator [Deltaproteobacteria bacterium]HNR12326.1 response regulator [Thermodesulfobacteriota bacterium]HNU71289.1 response regulator [Thermodesulfobacteriota bacterium]HOC39128.1 response regulator [Thermodesulfobacteriota bacterium]